MKGAGYQGDSRRLGRWKQLDLGLMSPVLFRPSWPNRLYAKRIAPNEPLLAASHRLKRADGAVARCRGIFRGLKGGDDGGFGGLVRLCSFLCFFLLLDDALDQ